MQNWSGVERWARDQARAGVSIRVANSCFLYVIILMHYIGFTGNSWEEELCHHTHHGFHFTHDGLSWIAWCHAGLLTVWHVLAGEASLIFDGMVHRCLVHSAVVGRLDRHQEIWSVAYLLNRVAVADGTHRLPVHRIRSLVFTRPALASVV